MLIHTKEVGADNRVLFEHQTVVNPLALTVAAESREDLVRSEGQAKAEHALTAYGADMLRLARSGAKAEALEKAAVNLAFFAWLVERVFEGLSAEEFVRSNLHFTILPGGGVKYDRIRKG